MVNFDWDNVPEVEPDDFDKEMIKRAGKRKGAAVKTIEEIEYNGKILVRVPKTLHRELVTKAKTEGISLNQFILYRLASGQ